MRSPHEDRLILEDQRSLQLIDETGCIGRKAPYRALQSRIAAGCDLNRRFLRRSLEAQKRRRFFGQHAAMRVECPKDRESRDPVGWTRCLERFEQPASRGAGLQAVTAVHYEPGGAARTRRQAQEAT